jgi:general nucleoside transport system ATP-binding protein
MPILDIKNITKSFGSLVANDSISLSLDAGEILALLGENGAGKTTLMNILFGHYTADKGSISIAGEVLSPGSTEAAIEAGVGMVHQHFTLADNLSVLDNIILGTEKLFAWRQDLSGARTKLEQMSKEFGLAVKPDVLVGDLSVGERQRVEILKVLYRNARVLILDEPTAVLTPQETEGLFATLKKLTDKGLGVIFISHKLNEILAISNRVAVLRRGVITGIVNTSDADRALLAEMMVGRTVTRPRLETAVAGEPVLQLSNLSVGGNAQERLLNTIDLQVCAHEIVGVAGVAGNGQSALASLLSGLIQPTSGDFELLGETLDQISPGLMVAKGVGRIPEDRHASGVVGEMLNWENLISENLKTPEISNAGLWIKKADALQRAEQLIEQYDVRCEGPLQQTKLLSGGNMQKLILARALSSSPSFILANQPVRGLDEGAIAYVQTQLLAARKRGAGILLISEDLDELMSLCDKIVVMYHGSLSAPFAPSQKTVQEIGLMMAGHRPETKQGAVYAN